MNVRRVFGISFHFADRVEYLTQARHLSHTDKFLCLRSRSDRAQFRLEHRGS